MARSVFSMLLYWTSQFWTSKNQSYATDCGSGSSLQAEKVPESGDPWGIIFFRMEWEFNILLISVMWLHSCENYKIPMKSIYVFDQPHLRKIKLCLHSSMCTVVNGSKSFYPNEEKEKLSEMEVL